MSIDLFPAFVHDDVIPSVVASAEIDDICQQIHDACQGFGTDEKALLHALGLLSQDMRYKVPVRYEQLYEKNLYELVKSESGERPFGKLLQYLSVNPAIAECCMIHDACLGMGTNEVLLTTIIAARSNKEVEVLKKLYFDRYAQDLGSAVSSETSGHLQQLLLTAMQGVEQVYGVVAFNDEKMAEDIKELHDMGVGEMGCDEARLFKFLCSAPPEYLKKLNIAFAGDDGVTLSKALEKELKGDTEFAATFILGMKVNPIDQIAKLIDKCMSGIGTNETLLNAALIRYQGMMNEIKIAFVELYGKTIQDRIKSECGSDYGDLLQLVVGE